MGEWRAGTWASLFGGTFLAAATMTVTWIGVRDSGPHPLSFWPIYVFIIMGIGGIAGFLVAIYAPHRLPGRSAAEREERRLEVRRHRSELELDRKKADAERSRRIFSFPRTDWDRREHTEAMNSLAREMRLQREARAVRSEESAVDDLEP